MGGGVFLVLLFLHWLFLEPKQFGLVAEKFFASQGAWFFAVASVFLALTVWFSLHVGKMVAFSAVVGSTLFFLTHGFKENAEAQEKRLMSRSLSDLSKIFYLEIIDMTFSMDGVLGAFAFTLSVPDHHPGQRAGRDHRAPDHGRQHRADPAAALHQERGDVLDTVLWGPS